MFLIVVVLVTVASNIIAVLTEEKKIVMCARAAFNGKVPLTLQEYSISFVNFIIDILFSISSWYCTLFFLHG